MAVCMNFLIVTFVSYNLHDFVLFLYTSFSCMTYATNRYWRMFVIHVKLLWKEPGLSMTGHLMILMNQQPIMERKVLADFCLLQPQEI